MRVRMLKNVTIPLDAINSKTYPVGWKGDVDEGLGLTWISKGSAEPLGPAVATRPVLTDEETAVLKLAAQHALSAESGGETVDPETGEIRDPEPPQSQAEVLASLTMAELRELAKVHGVKTFGVKRAAIEADILAKLGA